MSDPGTVYKEKNKEDATNTVIFIGILIYTREYIITALVCATN